jgi:ABC-type branched-subunit amino acid transport system substrate-binding protein
LLTITALPLHADALTPSEARGKQIFLHGASPSGTPVTASFGSGGNDLPGESFPCANCHGLDGRGKPEGDVAPSNIRWLELTKSYGPEHEGRKHPPYTERSLKRAITLGLDPAGQVLNPVMPRFHLAWQDLDDLISYLKKLEEDIDPGLSAASVSIGVMLPPAESMSPVADAIRAVLDAYASAVNQDGGIFGRKFELRYFNAPSNPSGQAAVLRDFIEREKPFALTASYLIQAEEPDSIVLAQEQTPLVGAFTLFPWTDSNPNPYLFYLDGGVPDEIDSLVEWVSRRRGTEGTAFILGTGDLSFDRPAEAAFRKHGWKEVEFWRAGVSLKSASAILCMNGETGAAMLRGADLPSQPFLLIPGSLQASTVMDLPGAADGRVALAFSWLPGQESEGAELYRKLAGAHKLPSAYIHSQFFALASIRTLAEGLKRAGRELSRDRLMQSLDGLYQFRTGITQPLTFTPGTRVGSRSDMIFLASPGTRSFIAAPH